MLFSSIKYRLFYSEYLHHDNGAKMYAEHCIDKISNSYLKRRNQIRNEVSELQEKVQNTNNKIDEITTGNSVLSSDDFHLVRVRYLLCIIFLLIIILSEWFLNFLSMMILIPGYGIFWDLTRIVLAGVLTAGAIYIAEYFFTTIMPIRKYGSEKSKNIINKTDASISLIFLIAIEIVVGIIASRRAEDIEGAEGGIIYWGFIILSLVLPLIGGLVWRQYQKYKDAYSNTKEVLRLKNKLEELHIRIYKRENEFNGLLETLISNYWEKINDFKIYKENYNERHGVNIDNKKFDFLNDFDVFTKKVEGRIKQKRN